MDYKGHLWNHLYVYSSKVINNQAHNSLTNHRNTKQTKRER